MHSNDEPMTESDRGYESTRSRSKLKWTGTRQAAPSPVEEAQMISEATQTATVAARSILASGGSQATALKTAKAAAKSSLLGKNIIDNDAASLSSVNSSTVGPKWNQKRKAKKQADIVASMALAAATNSIHGGFNKPTNAELPTLMTSRAPPRTITGEQGLVSPLYGKASPSRSKHKSPKSLGSSRARSPRSKSKSADIGSPMAMELHTISERKSSSSSKVLNLNNSTLDTKSHDRMISPRSNQRNSNDLSAVDLNSEDPIYWGNSNGKRNTSNRRKGRGYATQSSTTDSDDGISALSKSDYIVRDNVSDETEFTEDEPRARETTDDDGMCLGIFACGCNGKDGEVEDSYIKYKEGVEQESLQERGREERDVPGEDEFRDEAEPRSESVQNYYEEDNHDENAAYHTIVLKSRYDPNNDTVGTPPRKYKVNEGVASPKSDKGGRRIEKLRSLTKKGKFFRSKKDVE